MKKIAGNEPESKLLNTPQIGVIQWFHIGDYKQVEKVIEELKKINVKHLRTGISWADWHTKEGAKWYEWLVPKIATEMELLPCFTYTPPSLGIEPKTSSPPKNPKDYADFLDVFINEYGKYFEWVELWNEPNNLNDWDWRIDPSWQIYSDMVVGAAYWVKKLGKKTLLGGMAPADPNWLDLMCRRNVLENIDAIAIHGFPGTWEFDWSDWKVQVNKIKSVLKKYDLSPELWITEAGYSSWRYDEYKQLCEFVKLIDAPVDRVYWYTAFDLHPALSHQDGFHEDERHYHFGLKKYDGSDKLIYRIWKKEGLKGVRELAKLQTLSKSEDAIFNEGSTGNSYSPFLKKKIYTNGHRPTLIIGGAGFIGTNVADKILSSGKRVIIFDNLSRPGVEENLKWLTKTHGNLIDVEIGDVCDPYLLRNLVKNVNRVFNFAAQVAVTTSLVDPIHDFEVNVKGVINLLEALRAVHDPPPLLFTSTNKVYGGLEDVLMQDCGMRYSPEDSQIAQNGISEKRSLDFHSPYGCSKGSADQYIIDYARSYNLPTVVFRMSCIYGPHQFGTEDQGWVAHFLIQFLKNKPLTIFGDGKQVRDILFVEDLVRAMLLAQDNIDKVKGNAFNIGGGVNNTISLLELLEMMSSLSGKEPKITFSKWRTGDQKYYVSDISKYKEAVGWEPKVDVKSGIERLFNWLSSYYGSETQIKRNRIIKNNRKKKLVS